MWISHRLPDSRAALQVLAICDQPPLTSLKLKLFVPTKSSTKAERKVVNQIFTDTFFLLGMTFCVVNMNLGKVIVFSLIQHW